MLCDWCKYEALSPVPSRCYRCQKVTEDSATCSACRRHSNLKHVWITSEYLSLSKVLIAKLKFERAQDAAQIIAELMSEKLPYFSRDTMVTFVPTATGRRRQRGYDQAELIARRLSVLLDLKFGSLLLRSGQSRQVGAAKAQRKRQLTEAFRPNSRNVAAARNVLLIDDIVTTGATIEAAAQTLKAAGIKDIKAAAFAQKSKY